MFPLFETFIAVFETKSFTKAATQCFISQPTATVRIRKLEELLNVKLFNRGQHQEVMPTSSAEVLYPRALQYLNDWSELQVQLKNQSPERKTFKISASHSAATTVLPVIFKTFVKDLPQLNVEVSLLDSQEVFEGVQNHEIHFGIIEKPMMSELTTTFPLFSDELVLAGDAEQEVFFIRETGSGVAHYTQIYLKESGKTPQNIVRMNSNDMIVAHLKSGLGASLISRRFVGEELPFQTLDEKYQRIFYGIHFSAESNDLLKRLITQIKTISEY